MANSSCDSNHSTIHKKDFKEKPNVGLEVSFEESIHLLPPNVNNLNPINATNGTSVRSRYVSESSTIGSNNTFKYNRRTVSPPDGGWGWVVVFASFMINLISDGVSLSFGIIFMELVDYFGESKSKTAWVGSLFLSIPLITGPIASTLTDHYGCRRVAICGSIMSALGFIAGQFATRIEHLFIAFSFSGLGLALCYVTSIVSVAYYFERRRSLATGLAVCGSGFGTFLFAPLTIFLLKHYGWRGTLLIIGGIFLNIVNFGALMRDLDLGLNSNDSIRSHDMERANNCDNCYSNSVIVNNKTINKICSEDQSNEDEQRMTQNSRLCSSLIHIPTYIRHNDTNAISHEVISELSLRKGGYLRRLLQRYPKLVAFFMPQEYQNCYDINVRNCPTNSVTFSLSDKQLKPLMEMTAQNGNHLLINPKKRDQIFDTNPILKNSLVPTTELSPLSSNFLRNLRLQRGSLTYRSAMLNIKKYRLRASSAPDIYRNSMVAIHEKSGFLYDLKDVFLDMIDFSNFKSFRYSLFCFSNFLLYVCVDVPYVCLPDLAITTGAADSESASYLISIIGILNTLGVVLVGYFGDKRWVDPSLLYSCFIAISGFSMAIIPWVHTYLGMALIAAIYGFTISANYALVSVILVNLISLDSFTNAYGLLLLTQGFGSLVGPPIAGWLFDFFGNYNIAFHLTGICIFISGALVVPIARSSNCLNIEDDSTEATESSRPVSPKNDESNQSISDSHETQDKCLKTSFDLKNTTLIGSDKSKEMEKGFNKNGVISNSKSFDNLNNSLLI